MTIVAWLKKKLRGWLLDEPPDDGSLECKIRSKSRTVRRRFKVVGTRGLYLIGTAVDLDGPTQMLLPPESSVDLGRWWALWRRFNAGAEVRWEEPDDPAARSPVLDAGGAVSKRSGGENGINPAQTPERA